MDCWFQMIVGGHGKDRGTSFIQVNASSKKSDRAEEAGGSLPVQTAH